MQSLPPSYNYNLLPISGLTKIGDLLNYDGPVLSLFKDDLSQHYLYYWVDFGENSNRWLVWKTKDENLYNYLNGEISLQDLIQLKDKDYVFIVDIDDELNYSNTIPLELRHIPADYLPESQSFYRLTLPPFAKDFVDKYESSENYYKVLMRQKSIVFNISPTITNFARAVTTHDAGSFLSRLTRSINGFIEEAFWTRYKDIIASATDYNRLLNEVKAVLTPRLFGLRYGSFEVSVGVDLVKKVDLKEFTEWQHDVLPEFKKDVVDVDYNDEEQLRAIAEKYSESAREKIYEPYIKIINSPHYELTIKDKADKVIKSYHKVDKLKERIIVPPKKIVEQEIPKGKTFINLVVEVTEGQNITEINKRLLQSGLLFSQQVNELHFQLDSASNSQIRIVFKSPIAYTFSLVNNLYTIYVEDLGLYLEHPDKNAVLQNLQTEIIRLYNTSQNADDVDTIKIFFDKVIDHVEQLSEAQ